jgi:hypothetical protein
MDLVEFFFGKLLRLEPKSDHEARGSKATASGISESPSARRREV